MILDDLASFAVDDSVVEGIHDAIYVTTAEAAYYVVDKPASELAFKAIAAVNRAVSDFRTSVEGAFSGVVIVSRAFMTP